MTSSNGNIFRATGPLWGEFTGHRWIPSQRPVTQSFDVFFDLRLNKRPSKQWRRRWYETTSRSLWRHCNGSEPCGPVNGPLLTSKSIEIISANCGWPPPWGSHSQGGWARGASNVIVYVFVLCWCNQDRFYWCPSGILNCPHHWTNADPIHWRIYAVLGVNRLQIIPLQFLQCQSL